MNFKIYLSFFKWIFMKIFGGCFNLAESFRRELKKGMPDSGMSILGFVLLGLIGLIAVVLVTAGITSETSTVRFVATIYLWMALFTFVYNVVKAAFECFCAEREELFEMLKR